MRHLRKWWYHLRLRFFPGQYVTMTVHVGTAPLRTGDTIMVNEEQVCITAVTPSSFTAIGRRERKEE